MRRALALFPAVLTLLGCVGVPEGLQPVEGFDLSRYLGRWYEVARLDHSFERGLSRVTAEYSLRPDGGVRVLNQGYALEKGTWKRAEGKAFFVHEHARAHLKVSFFGPFYGSYVVVDLDREHYQWALVAGPSRSYLWILSRTPALDPEVQRTLVAKAKTLGFETDRLILVDQGTP